MPLYKGINEGNLELWLHDLNKLSRNIILNNNNKYLVAYFFITLYEYYQVVCHFRLYGNKYNMPFNAILKDIKLCLKNDSGEYNYVINTFHALRNSLGHGPIADASLAILKDLLNETNMFINILKVLEIDCQLICNVKKVMNELGDLKWLKENSF